MKVIFVPDYSKGNPYQKLLADSLSKEGTEVSFGMTSYLFSALKSIKNSWKPDILHLHWIHPFLLASSKGKTIVKSILFIAELVILRIFGIKIVWTVHNVVNHEKKFSSLELFFTKFAIRFFNIIITHSHFAKNKVKEVYNITDNPEIKIIPHGNYINNYKNTIGRIEARNKLKIDEKEVVLMYFGLIRPYKGVFELIEAFKELNVLQKKLLIVGKPCSNEVAKNILKRCNKNENIKTIFEFIPDNVIQIYMNAADVVVLPYRDILTSGAAILAMSFSNPVIAPAIGCIPEALDIGGSFLYDPSEKDGLVKAMRQVFDVDLGKMGRHNFKLAKRLGWDEIAKKTYEVYCECLKRKR